MDWQLVPCGRWGGPAPLTEGEMSLAKSGTACFLVSDLEAVKIVSHAAVLADPGGVRLAIRAPRTHERSEAVAVSIVKTKGGRPTGRARISLRRGIEALGVTPSAVAGRYAMLSVGDLLVLPLGQPALDELERANAAAEKQAELSARDEIDRKAAAQKAAREAGRHPAVVSAAAGRK